MVSKAGKVLLMFDMDMTLTPARSVIEPAMMETLKKCQAKGIHLAIVSGSDLSKVYEQVPKKFVDEMEWCFAENGLYTLKSGVFYEKQSFKDWLGEDRLKQFLNFCLHYLADIDIPFKRGTFIEYRTGMLNVSPVGRNCSMEERHIFEAYDKEHGVRAAFVNALKEKFAGWNLRFSIGGAISFDVFPEGWDKSYALKYVEDDYEHIHFFGDKCSEGGNDHEIFKDSRTIGHEVENPEDTIK